MTQRASRRIPRGAPWFLFLAALLGARSADAQPSPVALLWNAPPECPSRDSVLEQAGRALGPPRVVSSHVVRADVERDAAGRWHAAVRIEGPGAQADRAFDADTCPAIASATAVVLAVLVEDGAQAEPSPAPPLRRDAPPAPQSPAPANARRGGQIALGAGGIVDQATMPAVAAGAELAVGWAVGGDRWRARALAMGAFFPVHSATLAGRPTEGGDFRLLTAAARACIGLVAGAFEVGPCAGPEIDTLQASGFGSSSPSDGSATWAAFALSALGGWRVAGPLYATLRVDGVVPLARPEFVVQTPGADLLVHRPAPALRAALGAEVRFP
jgi:hypothetical protein